MKKILNFLSKKILTVIFILLFLLNLVSSYLNYQNYSTQGVDLPEATRQLIIKTIKNELDFSVQCVHKNCKKEVRNLENVMDEISYANQLGRLDTVSIVLALFGLVIGFASIYGFVYIEKNSERIAKETTEEWIKNGNAEKVIIEYLKLKTQGENLKIEKKIIEYLKLEKDHISKEKTKLDSKQDYGDSYKENK